MSEASWHGTKLINGKLWKSGWDYSKAHDHSDHGFYEADQGYELVMFADDGTEYDYSQAATAAVLKTPDDKLWAVEDGGGCSCWSGPNTESITGPYDSVTEAMAAISEHLRERLEVTS